MPNSESLGYVYSLHIGPVGHLWIATLGNGLWRWDGQALFKVQGGSIPEKCNVYAVTHSKTFEVFVAHDGYISKIMPNEVPRLLADSGEAVAAWSLHCPGNSRLFAGTSKGLLIYETETGQLLKRLTDCEDNWEFTTSRSINSYDGQIICGLASGLKYIDIDRLEGIVDRPVLRASMLKWYQGEPQLTGGVYQIPQGKWRVCVNVNMHWYYDEGDCEMQYLLEGFDQSWSEPHPVETITYTSLPAGDYVLKARVLSPVAGYGADSVLARIRVIPD